MLRINYAGSMLPLKLTTMLLLALLFMTKSTDGRVINYGNGTLGYDFTNFPTKPKKTIPRFVAVPNYPFEQIDELLKRDGEKFYEFFGNDTKQDSREDELKSRTNDMERHFLCRSEIKLKHHKGYVETDTTVLIVNTEKFIQGVNEETCREEGESPFGYRKVKCVQVFTSRRLLAFDNSTKNISMTNVELPSGCHATIIEGIC